MLPRRPVFALAAIVIAGAALRFWGLSKPAWLDEVITMLIAAGRGPESVPIGAAIPLSWIATLFSPRTTATAGQVVALLRHPAVQHTHPPLFYLAAHAVLRSQLLAAFMLITIVRTVSVLFGLLAIVLIYLCAADVFDDSVARLAAGLTAVSPFGVMVSQEGRNYTIALCFVTLTTWATIAIARRAADPRPAVGWWAVWASCAALSCYSHYYAVLACAAQAVLLAYAFWQARSRRGFAALALASAAAAAAFLPWAVVLRAHLSSPEQAWMFFDGPDGALIAIYETLVAWHTMLLGRPWSTPGLPILGDASRVFGIVFVAWAVTIIIIGARRTAPSAREREPRRVLMWMTPLVNGGFAAAMALGRKDLVSEARYHFPYYPAAVLLAAWVLCRLPEQWPSGLAARILAPKRGFAIAVVVALSALNGALVSAEVEDWKPPETAAIAARFDAAAPLPVLAVAGVGSFHEIVNALAHFLEWSRHTAPDRRAVAFVWRADRPHVVFGSPGPVAPFRQGLAGLRLQDAPATLWLHNNGMMAEPYPQRIVVAGAVACSQSAAALEDDARAEGLANDFADPIYRRYRCGVR